MSQDLGIVGYAIYRKGDLEGTLGRHYTYVMAGNGLLVAACNELLTGVVPIGPATVRGLQPALTGVQLHHGKIPRAFFDGAVLSMSMNRTRELYLAIVWEEGRYRVAVPPQLSSPSHIAYKTVPNTVLELHSHPSFPARFSATDDADEQGFKLYGVVGRLDLPQPEFSFRLGIYGHFQDIPWEEIFEEEAPA